MMQRLINFLLSLLGFSGDDTNTSTEQPHECQLGAVEIPSDTPEPDVPFISEVVFSSQAAGATTGTITPATDCTATVRPELGLVNIRTGPRLEFTPAIQTEGGVMFDLVGASERDEDGYRWFQLSLAPIAGSGWIRGDLLNISRNCLKFSYITEDDVVPEETSSGGTGTGSNPGTTTPPTTRFDAPANVTITDTYRGGHQAIDLGTPMNTPIRAATNGTLIRVVECTACTAAQPNFRGSPSCSSIYDKPEWGYGYGNFVVIRHDYAGMPPQLRSQMDSLGLTNGFVYVLYAHFSRLNVHFGQQVSSGHVLGLTGNHGCSTAPHLHFEVRVGNRELVNGAWQQQRPVNPNLMFDM